MKREQTRFLKTIVWTCIRFLMLMFVACYVAAWFGVDTDSILTHACTVFGGELLLAVVLKLSGDKDAKKDGQDEKKREDISNG